MWFRPFAAGLSVVYLLSNVVFSHALESNFWEARRRAASRQPSQETQQLARLSPSQPSAIKILNGLPSVQNNPIASSALSSELRSVLPRRVIDEHASLFQALPPACGAVRQVLSPRSGTSSRVVVHIQDVHRHLEAQENIGKTVEGLIDRKQVDLVGLEGAFGPLPLDRFRNFPRRETIRKAADFLFRERKISGPVRTALTVSGDIPPVVGIDDSVHYAANVAAYREASPRLKEYGDRLALQRERLEKQKLQTFNPGLLEFDRKARAYREKKTGLGGHVRELAARGLPLSRDLQGFLDALAMEEAMDFKAVEAERKRLIEVLVGSLTRKETEDLASMSASYRAGQARYADFYGHLKNLCWRHGIVMSKFPAMDDYIRYVLLSDGINAEKLLSDIARLERDAYAALARSPAEAELAAQSRRLDFAAKLLDFSLTSEEWQEYKALSGLPVPPGPAADDARDLTPAELASFENFYREAEARDAAMARNLDAAMAEAGASRAVLVTGGFHSRGLETELLRRGMTVVRFAPRVTRVAEAESGAAALSVFTREKTPLEKMFEGEKLFLAEPPFSLEVVRGDLPALGVAEVVFAGVAREILGRPDGAKISPDDVQKIFSLLAPDLKDRVAVAAEIMPGGKVSVEMSSTAGDGPSVTAVVSFGAEGAFSSLESRPSDPSLGRRLARWARQARESFGALARRAAAAAHPVLSRAWAFVRDRIAPEGASRGEIAFNAAVAVLLTVFFVVALAQSPTPGNLVFLVAIVSSMARGFVFTGVGIETQVRDAGPRREFPPTAMRVTPEYLKARGETLESFLEKLVDDFREKTFVAGVGKFLNEDFDKQLFKLSLSGIIHGHRPGAVVIALDGDKIVGYAVSRQDTLSNNIGEIMEMAVDSDYRHHGPRMPGRRLSFELFQEALAPLLECPSLERIIMHDVSEKGASGRIARRFGFKKKYGTWVMDLPHVDLGEVDGIRFQIKRSPRAGPLRILSNGKPRRDQEMVYLHPKQNVYDDSVFWIQPIAKGRKRDAHKNLVVLPPSGWNFQEEIHVRLPGKEYSQRVNLNAKTGAQSAFDGETISVLHGKEAWILLQKHDPTAPSVVKEVRLVKISKGEGFLIPSGYAYSIVNPSNTNALAIVTGARAMNEIPFRGEPAYYFVENEFYGISYVPNNHYAAVPPVLETRADGFSKSITAYPRSPAVLRRVAPRAMRRPLERYAASKVTRGARRSFFGREMSPVESAKEDLQGEFSVGLGLTPVFGKIYTQFVSEGQRSPAAAVAGLLGAAEDALARALVQGLATLALRALLPLAGIPGAYADWIALAVFSVFFASPWFHPEVVSGGASEARSARAEDRIQLFLLAFVPFALSLAVGGSGLRLDPFVTAAIASSAVHGLMNVYAHFQGLVLGLKTEDKTAYWFNEGTVIGGRFKILRPLGRGGEAEVYLCDDIVRYRAPGAPARQVAVKIAMVPADPEKKAEWLETGVNHEYQVLRNVRHPRVPAVIDMGPETPAIEEKYLFFAMDYIPGPTAEDLIYAQDEYQLALKAVDRISDPRAALAGRRRFLELPQPGMLPFLETVLGAAEALRDLHAFKPPLIHRDMKPANIKIAPDGYYLLDFGVAEFMGEKRKVPMIGTEGYAPLEQIHGELTPGSDLYGLGATLSYMLTGIDPRLELPNSFRDRPITVERIRGRFGEETAEQLGPELIGWIDEWIRRATIYEESDANPRPTMAEALAELWAIVQEIRAAPARANELLLTPATSAPGEEAARQALFGAGSAARPLEFDGAMSVESLVVLGATEARYTDYAFAILGDMAERHPDQVLEELAGLLTDPDPGISGAAAYYLGRLLLPSSADEPLKDFQFRIIDLLGVALNHPKVPDTVRELAAVSLGGALTAGAARSLIKALRSEAPSSVRRQCVESLALLAAVKDDPRAEKWAEEFVGLLRAPRMRRSETPAPERLAAGRALAAFEAPEAVPVLLSLLDSEDASVVGAMENFLEEIALAGRIDLAEGQAVLKDALFSASSTVRRRARRLLDGMSWSASDPRTWALFELARDTPNPEAFFALDPQAQEDLAGELFSLRQWGWEDLHAVLGAAALPLLARTAVLHPAWTAAPGKAGRNFELFVGGLREESVVPFLIQILRETNDLGVFRAVERALAGIGPAGGAAGHALLARSRDAEADPAVRQYASERLAFYGPVAEEEENWNRLILSVAILDHGGPLNLKVILNRLVLALGLSSLSVETVEGLGEMGKTLAETQRDLRQRLEEIEKSGDFRPADFAELRELVRRWFEDLVLFLSREEFLKLGEIEEMPGIDEKARELLAGVKSVQKYLGREHAVRTVPLQGLLAGRERAWDTKQGDVHPTVIAPEDARAREASIRADPDLLALALARLVSNAAKELNGNKPSVTPEIEKQIQTTWFVQDGRARIEFSNPGRFPEEMLEDRGGVQAIFQLDHGRPTFDRGIGLKFAAQAIRDMGGTIRFENRDGPLVVAVVEFPLADAASAPKFEQTGSAVEAGTQLSLMAALGVSVKFLLNGDAARPAFAGVPAVWVVLFCLTLLTILLLAFAISRLTGPQDDGRSEEKVEPQKELARLRQAREDHHQALRRNAAEEAAYRKALEQLPKARRQLEKLSQELLGLYWEQIVYSQSRKRISPFTIASLVQDITICEIRWESKSRQVHALEKQLQAPLTQRLVGDTRYLRVLAEDRFAEKRFLTNDSKPGRRGIEEERARRFLLSVALLSVLCLASMAGVYSVYDWWTFRITPFDRLIYLTLLGGAGAIAGLVGFQKSPSLGGKLGWGALGLSALAFFLWKAAALIWEAVTRAFSGGFGLQALAVGPLNLSFGPLLATLGGMLADIPFGVGAGLSVVVPVIEALAGLTPFSQAMLVMFFYGLLAILSMIGLTKSDSLGGKLGWGALFLYSAVSFVLKSLALIWLAIQMDFSGGFGLQALAIDPSAPAPAMQAGGWGILLIVFLGMMLPAGGKRGKGSAPAAGSLRERTNEVLALLRSKGHGRNIYPQALPLLEALRNETRRAGIDFVPDYYQMAITQIRQAGPMTESRLEEIASSLQEVLAFLPRDEQPGDSAGGGLRADLRPVVYFFAWAAFVALSRQTLGFSGPVALAAGTAILAALFLLWRGIANVARVAVQTARWKNTYEKLGADEAMKKADLDKAAGDAKVHLTVQLLLGAVMLALAVLLLAAVAALSPQLSDAIRQALGFAGIGNSGAGFHAAGGWGMILIAVFGAMFGGWHSPKVAWQNILLLRLAKVLEVTPEDIRLEYTNLGLRVYLADEGEIAHVDYSVDGNTLIIKDIFTEDGRDETGVSFRGKGIMASLITFLLLANNAKKFIGEDVDDPGQGINTHLQDKGILQNLRHSNGEVITASADVNLGIAAAYLLSGGSAAASSRFWNWLEGATGRRFDPDTRVRHAFWAETLYYGLPALAGIGGVLFASAVGWLDPGLVRESAFLILAAVSVWFGADHIDRIQWDGNAWRVTGEMKWWERGAMGMIGGLFLLPLWSLVLLSPAQIGVWTVLGALSAVTLLHWGYNKLARDLGWTAATGILMGDDRDSLDQRLNSALESFGHLKQDFQDVMIGRGDVDQLLEDLGKFIRTAHSLAQEIDDLPGSAIQEGSVVIMVYPEGDLIGLSKRLREMAQQASTTRLYLTQVWTGDGELLEQTDVTWLWPGSDNSKGGGLQANILPILLLITFLFSEQLLRGMWRSIVEAIQEVIRFLTNGYLFGGAWGLISGFSLKDSLVMDPAGPMMRESLSGWVVALTLLFGTVFGSLKAPRVNWAQVLKARLAAILDVDQKNIGIEDANGIAYLKVGRDKIATVMYEVDGKEFTLLNHYRVDESLERFPEKKGIMTCFIAYLLLVHNATRLEGTTLDPVYGRPFREHLEKVGILTNLKFTGRTAQADVDLEGAAKYLFGLSAAASSRFWNWLEGATGRRFDPDTRVRHAFWAETLGYLGPVLLAAAVPFVLAMQGVLDTTLTGRLVFMVVLLTAANGMFGSDHTRDIRSIEKIGFMDVGATEPWQRFLMGVLGFGFSLPLLALAFYDPARIGWGILVPAFAALVAAGAFHWIYNREARVRGWMAATGWGRGTAPTEKTIQFDNETYSFVGKVGDFASAYRNSNGDLWVARQAPIQHSRKIMAAKAADETLLRHIPEIRFNETYLLTRVVRKLELSELDNLRDHLGVTSQKLLSIIVSQEKAIREALLRTGLDFVELGLGKGDTVVAFEDGEVKVYLVDLGIESTARGYYPNLRKSYSGSLASTIHLLMMDYLSEISVRDLDRVLKAYAEAGIGDWDDSVGGYELFPDPFESDRGGRMDVLQPVYQAVDRLAEGMSAAAEEGLSRPARTWWGQSFAPAALESGPLAAALLWLAAGPAREFVQFWLIHLPLGLSPPLAALQGIVIFLAAAAVLAAVWAVFFNLPHAISADADWESPLVFGIFPRLRNVRLLPFGEALRATFARDRLAITLASSVLGAAALFLPAGTPYWSAIFLAAQLLPHLAVNSLTAPAERPEEAVARLRFLGDWLMRLPSGVMERHRPGLFKAYAGLIAGLRRGGEADKIFKALQKVAQRLGELKGDAGAYEITLLPSPLPWGGHVAQIATPAAVNVYLVPLPQGGYLLADGGYAVLADDLLAVLRDRLGLDPAKDLRVVFASHMDADHIGGLPGILEAARAKGGSPALVLHPKAEEALVSRGPGDPLQAALSGVFALASGLVSPDLGRYRANRNRAAGFRTESRVLGGQEFDAVVLGEDADGNQLCALRPLSPAHTVDTQLLAVVPRQGPPLVLGGDAYEASNGLSRPAQAMWMALTTIAGVENLDPQPVDGLRAALEREGAVVLPGSGVGFFSAGDYAAPDPSADGLALPGARRTLGVRPFRIGRDWLKWSYIKNIIQWSSVGAPSPVGPEQEAILYFESADFSDHRRRSGFFAVLNNVHSPNFGGDRIECRDLSSGETVFISIDNLEAGWSAGRGIALLTPGQREKLSAMDEVPVETAEAEILRPGVYPSSAEEWNELWSSLPAGRFGLLVLMPLFTGTFNNPTLEIVGLFLIMGGALAMTIPSYGPTHDSDGNDDSELSAKHEDLGKLWNTIERKMREVSSASIPEQREIFIAELDEFIRSAMALIPEMRKHKWNKRTIAALNLQIGSAWITKQSVRGKIAGDGPSLKGLSNWLRGDDKHTMNADATLTLGVFAAAIVFAALGGASPQAHRLLSFLLNGFSGVDVVQAGFGSLPGMVLVLLLGRLMFSALAPLKSGDLESPSPKMVSGLSPREWDVWILIAEGLENPEIGKELGIDKGYVRNRVSDLMEKLFVTDRTQLAVKYALWKQYRRQAGITDPKEEEALERARVRRFPAWNGHPGDESKGSGLSADVTLSLALFALLFGGEVFPLEVWRDFLAGALSSLAEMGWTTAAGVGLAVLVAGFFGNIFLLTRGSSDLNGHEKNLLETVEPFVSGKKVPDALRAAEAAGLRPEELKQRMRAICFRMGADSWAEAVRLYRESGESGGNLVVREAPPQKVRRAVSLVPFGVQAPDQRRVAGLNPIEKRVWELLGRGLSDKAIQEKLREEGLKDAQDSVRHYVQALKRKLGVSTRNGLSAKYAAWDREQNGSGTPALLPLALGGFGLSQLLGHEFQTSIGSFGDIWGSLALITIGGGFFLAAVVLPSVRRRNISRRGSPETQREGRKRRLQEAVGRDSPIPLRLRAFGVTEDLYQSMDAILRDLEPKSREQAARRMKFSSVKAMLNQVSRRISDPVHESNRERARDIYERLKALPSGGTATEGLVTVAQLREDPSRFAGFVRDSKHFIGPVDWDSYREWAAAYADGFLAEGKTRQDLAFAWGFGTTKPREGRVIKYEKKSGAALHKAFGVVIRPRSTEGRSQEERRAFREIYQAAIRLPTAHQRAQNEPGHVVWMTPDEFDGHPGRFAGWLAMRRAKPVWVDNEEDISVLFRAVLQVGTRRFGLTRDGYEKAWGLPNAEEYIGLLSRRASVGPKTTDMLAALAEALGRLPLNQTVPTAPDIPGDHRPDSLIGLRMQAPARSEVWLGALGFGSTGIIGAGAADPLLQQALLIAGGAAVGAFVLTRVVAGVLKNWRTEPEFYNASPIKAKDYMGFVVQTAIFGAVIWNAIVLNGLTSSLTQALVVLGGIIGGSLSNVRERLSQGKVHDYILNMNLQDMIVILGHLYLDVRLAEQAALVLGLSSSIGFAFGASLLALSLVARQLAQYESSSASKTGRWLEWLHLLLLGVTALIALNLGWPLNALSSGAAPALSSMAIMLLLPLTRMNIKEIMVPIAAPAPDALSLETILSNLGGAQTYGLKGMDADLLSVVEERVRALDLEAAAGAGQAPDADKIQGDPKFRDAFFGALLGLVEGLRLASLKGQTNDPMSLADRLRAVRSMRGESSVRRPVVNLVPTSGLTEENFAALRKAAAEAPEELFVAVQKDAPETAVGESLPANLKIVSAATLKDIGRGRALFALDPVESALKDRPDIEIPEGAEFRVIADLTRVLIDKTGCDLLKNVSVVPLGAFGPLFIASKEFDFLYKAALYYAQQA